jgi:uncharacterized UPF0160 family protein
MVMEDIFEEEVKLVKILNKRITESKAQDEDYAVLVSLAYLSPTNVNVLKAWKEKVKNPEVKELIQMRIDELEGKSVIEKLDRFRELYKKIVERCKYDKVF